MRRVILVDNGSLEPASTLQLRRLATELAVRIGIPVDPVSLAHSVDIPPEKLDGRRAELFEPGIERVLAAGVDELAVVPLFVGPSHAIMRHVPAVIAGYRQRFPSVRITQSPPLFAPGETRLARILADHVREQLRLSDAAAAPRVAVVDHGSPSRAVTAVRDEVTTQLRALLGSESVEVAACSMERRAGTEFDFNEPQLEKLLAQPGWRTVPLVIGLLFIAPGRHAGPTGDVAQAVARMRCSALENVRFTRLMGEHPLIVEILADRAMDALTANAVPARSPSPL